MFGVADADGVEDFYRVLAQDLKPQRAKAMVKAFVSSLGPFIGIPPMMHKTSYTLSSRGGGPNSLVTGTPKIGLNNQVGAWTILTLHPNTLTP